MGQVQPQDLTALPLQTQGAGTYNSPDIQTNGCSMLDLVTKVTNNTGNTGTATVTIQGKDQTSGDYRTILTGTAIATVSDQLLKVGPTVAASANAIAQDYLPETIRIQVVIATANVTFEVGLSLTD